jgi:uncharacterized membrane protein HdeD (DUF308 family)
MMNWMRYLAIGIGVVFGVLYVVFGVAPAQRAISFSDLLLIFCVPVSLVLATVVGLKFERLAGWWQIAAAVAAAVQLAIRKHGDPVAMLAAIALLCLPMVCAGLLWLSHARPKRRMSALYGAGDKVAY